MQNREIIENFLSGLIFVLLSETPSKLTIREGMLTKEQSVLEDGPLLCPA